MIKWMKNVRQKWFSPVMYRGDLIEYQNNARADELQQNMDKMGKQINDKILELRSSVHIHLDNLLYDVSQLTLQVVTSDEIGRLEARLMSSLYEMLTASAEIKYSQEIKKEIVDLKASQDILLNRLLSYEKLAENAESFMALGKALCKKLPVNHLKNSNYIITETTRFQNDFLWVTDRKATDPISRFIQQGYTGDSDWDTIGDSIWNLLPRKGVFLDIGANLGAFSLPLASFGWTGYAIEASAKNADLLKMTISLNDFDIKVCDKAIYDHTGAIYFVQNGPQGFIQNDACPNEDYEEIEAICLNDYRENEVLCNISGIDFIKMDIEGSEVAAIRGMNKFLEDMGFPPIFAEVNVWNLFCMGETPLSYFQEINKLGYFPYMITNGKLYRCSLYHFPESPCTDFLFLRNENPFKEMIVGEYEQNREKLVKGYLELLTDFRKWIRDNDMDTNVDPVLPHIALFRYLPLYSAYYPNEDAIRIMDDIREILKNNSNPVFIKMLKQN